jgi:hypothetical protein
LRPSPRARSSRERVHSPARVSFPSCCCLPKRLKPQEKKIHRRKHLHHRQHNTKQNTAATTMTLRACSRVSQFSIAPPSAPSVLRLCEWTTTFRVAVLFQPVPSRGSQRPPPTSPIKPPKSSAFVTSHSPPATDTICAENFSECLMCAPACYYSLLRHPRPHFTPTQRTCQTVCKPRQKPPLLPTSGCRASSCSCK